MKLYQRERFSIFKARRSEQKKEWFQGMCRAKLDGELTLEGDVFYLDGREIFRAAEDTTREWQKWHQLYEELDNSPWFNGEAIARGFRSKKNWGGGGLKYRDTVRRQPHRCGTGSAIRRREEMARDRYRRGK